MCEREGEDVEMDMMDRGERWNMETKPEEGQIGITVRCHEILARLPVRTVCCVGPRLGRPRFDAQSSPFRLLMDGARPSATAGRKIRRPRGRTQGDVLFPEILDGSLKQNLWSGHPQSPRFSLNPQICLRGITRM